MNAKMFGAAWKIEFSLSSHGKAHGMVGTAQPSVGFSPNSARFSPFHEPRWREFSEFSVAITIFTTQKLVSHLHITFFLGLSIHPQKTVFHSFSRFKVYDFGEHSATISAFVR